MLRYLTLVLLLAVTSARGQRGTIIFTGSANGAYQNCLCPDKPYGGLARRVQFIENIRVNNPEALVLDAGDNFKDYLSDPIQSIMVEGFRLIDYDLIGLGDQDIAYAPEAYYGLEALVKTIGEPVTIVKGEITYSILPILHPKSTRFYPEGLFGPFALDGWEAAVKEWIAGADVKGTVRILLSHAGYDTDKKIADQYPEIDLIVGGHSQTELKKQTKVNGVIILHAGANAGYVGEISFKVKRSKIKYSSYELHPITLSLPVHPTMLELVTNISTGH